MAHPPSDLATAARIRTGGFDFRAHLNMGRNGHSYSYAHHDFPDVVLAKHSPRKGPAERQLYVGEVEVPIDQLDHAAELVNLRRLRDPDAIAKARAQLEAEAEDLVHAFGFGAGNDGLVHQRLAQIATALEELIR